MTETITFPTPLGEVRGELALPAKPGPAIILVHEWWGLNDDMRRMAARFAAEGYVAMLVDLYGGRSASTPEEAMALSSAMKTADAMQIIAGAVAYLHGRGSAKIAVTGFCLGGGMALAAACNVPGIDAAVPFYGTPKEEFVKLSKALPPVLGHYAKDDGFVSFERVAGIQKRATELGASFELHGYDGPHAFMREADPNAYHEPSATLAWARTVAFLRKHLA
jgi:carboxymethylenebutenolidase